MTIQDAIKNMEHHQEWRTWKGNDEDESDTGLPMLDPYVISEALNTLIAYAKACLNEESGLLSK